MINQKTEKQEKQMAEKQTEERRLAELTAGHVNAFIYNYGPNWIFNKDASKQVRRAIREVWGLKKSAANEKFRKLFVFDTCLYKDKEFPFGHVLDTFGDDIVEVAIGGDMTLKMKIGDGENLMRGQLVKSGPDGKVYSMDAKNNKGDNEKVDFNIQMTDKKTGENIGEYNLKQVELGSGLTVFQDEKGIYSMDFKNGSKVVVIDKPSDPIRGKKTEDVYVDGSPLGKLTKDSSEFIKSLDDPDARVTGGFKVNGDKATLEIKNAGEIRTLEDLVSYCKVDLNKWEPKSFVPSLQRGVLNVRAEFKKRV